MQNIEISLNVNQTVYSTSILELGLLACIPVDCEGETRSGARSPTGKVTDVKQIARQDTANSAAAVTNNHLVVHMHFCLCSSALNSISSFCWSFPCWTLTACTTLTETYHEISCQSTLKIGRCVSSRMTYHCCGGLLLSYASGCHVTSAIRQQPCLPCLDVVDRRQIWSGHSSWRCVTLAGCRLQSHISLSVRPIFFRHVVQWPCPVRNRFINDYWRRGRWKRKVGSWDHLLVRCSSQ